MDALSPEHLSNHALCSYWWTARRVPCDFNGYWIWEFMQNVMLITLMKAN